MEQTAFARAMTAIRGSALSRDALELLEILREREEQGMWKSTYSCIEHAPGKPEKTVLQLGFAHLMGVSPFFAKEPYSSGERLFFDRWQTQPGGPQMAWSLIAAGGGLLRTEISALIPEWPVNIHFTVLADTPENREAQRLGLAAASIMPLIQDLSSSAPRAMAEALTRVSQTLPEEQLERFLDALAEWGMGAGQDSRQGSGGACRWGRDF